jgi:hypothetical protein
MILFRHTFDLVLNQPTGSLGRVLPRTKSREYSYPRHIAVYIAADSRRPGSANMLWHLPTSRAFAAARLTFCPHAFAINGRSRLTSRDLGLFASLLVCWTRISVHLVGAHARVSSAHKPRACFKRSDRTVADSRRAALRTSLYGQPQILHNTDFFGNRGDS